MLNVLFASILTAPALLFYLGLASSMALGASIVGIVVIAVSSIRHASGRMNAAVQSSGWALISVAALYGIVLHMTVVLLLGIPVALDRAIRSLIPLVIILSSGHGLARLLLSSSEADVHRALRFTTVMLITIGAISVFGFAPAGPRDYFKPVFPFTEPAHFALASIPLLMYWCVRLHGKMRVLALAVGLTGALTLQSLTFVVGCLLAALISVRLRVLPWLLIPFTALLLQLDLSYYTERVDFSNDNSNLSTLVFLQGSQLIGESWEKSGGWGLGFQQLGVHGTDVPAAELINLLLDNDSNLLDGGFTLAKLVSEFGALGLILVAIYLCAAWLAVVHLRRVSSSDKMTEGSAITLARCMLVSFSIELFVRGGGYFSGTSILLTAAIVMLLATRRRDRREFQKSCV